MFLSALPHQYPFRAASALVRRDEKTIEGTYLVSADEPLPLEVMLVEAMAQFAGALVFDAGKPGMLTGVDRCEIDRLPIVGDVVRIVVTLDASFGQLYRFSGVGSIDGEEAVRATVILSEAKDPRIEANAQS